MQKIKFSDIWRVKCWLKMLGYELYDEKGKHNRWANRACTIFVWIYTIASVVNAVVGIKDLHLFDEQRNFHVGTISMLIVNISVLLEINVKLYIQQKDIQNSKIVEFPQTRDVKPIRNRMHIIMGLYGVMVVVFLCIAFCGARDRALIIIVLSVTVVTFFEDLVEIGINRYHAYEQILVPEKQEKGGENIS